MIEQGRGLELKWKLFGCRHGGEVGQLIDPYGGVLNSDREFDCKCCIFSALVKLCKWFVHIVPNIFSRNWQCNIFDSIPFKRHSFHCLITRRTYSTGLPNTVEFKSIRQSRVTANFRWHRQYFFLDFSGFWRFVGKMKKSRGDELIWILQYVRCTATACTDKKLFSSCGFQWGRVLNTVKMCSH
jgi:hypothetical protein